jgi:hypothetical protein
VTEYGAVTLQVQTAPDGDSDELAAMTGRLRLELLELDIAGVNPVSEDSAPDNAKGLATLAGMLVVRLGTFGGLRAVVDSVRSWAARTGRTVEVSLDGDVLKLTGVTSDQQDRLIDGWLAQHAPGA